MVVGVRIRHLAPIVPATVERADTDGFSLRLASPQDAITPGQSAVLYESGGAVLGGGIISNVS